MERNVLDLTAWVEAVYSMSATSLPTQFHCEVSRVCKDWMAGGALINLTPCNLAVVSRVLGRVLSMNLTFIKASSKTITICK